MNRRRLAWLAAAVVVVAVAGTAIFWVRTMGPYKGYAGSEQIVEIPPGSGPAAIGRRLVEAGVVRDQLTWRLTLALAGGAARSLKAGEYRFVEPMTPRAVVQKLVKGEVDLLRITFPEGLTIAEMAQLYEQQGLGTAQAFMNAASDRSLIAELDPEAADLEGYLFPDTYGIARRSSASTLVRAMVARFTTVFDAQLREAVKQRGFTVREAVTLASLVEKETAVSAERPIVAAVYLNRLKADMILQADPTVIYALRRAGLYNGNLTRENLMYDSPYNTYRYTGLPPGPIAAPGRGALEAVAAPADVDYLYFVSRNDGSHEFSRTYEEHRRKVHEYQVQYFRRAQRGRTGTE
ncbi:MAG TPA: endolytic transglycosylase MltG [Vicinamibacterales bacterium]|nr:endolytic transglycosylase MltG [Vicinamibacterales bacterium]